MVDPWVWLHMHPNKAGDVWMYPARMHNAAWLEATIRSARFRMMHSTARDTTMPPRVADVISQ